ncbi:MAG: cytochrome-c peroxidase [Bacteroidetes bacterium]|nr:cytochrome-c peroxidase [Bacteroidota bacterium]
MYSLKKHEIFTILIPIICLVFSCVEVKKESLLATEAELGEALYFDPMLSRDSSVSCASCHKPEFAFADNTPVSTGIYHKKGTRNTPTSMNQSNRNAYFWDGRAETLEDQALGPIENPIEMDLPISIAVRRLIRNERYKNAFMSIYGKMPDAKLLAQALSGFEKTLETNNTAFDKYMSQSDTTLFTESAKRGLNLFNGKAKCFDCHFGVDFSGNDKFKNIGLYNGKELNDKGRFEITHNPKELGAFKTPGLRNIAQTAPYMHNGMFKTLKEVIEHYDQPDKFVKGAINRDTSMNKPLGLTANEKKDIENFMLSLSDERFNKKIK